MVKGRHLTSTGICDSFRAARTKIGRVHNQPHDASRRCMVQGRSVRRPTSARPPHAHTRAHTQPPHQDEQDAADRLLRRSSPAQTLSGNERQRKIDEVSAAIALVPHIQVRVSGVADLCTTVNSMVEH